MQAKNVTTSYFTYDVWMFGGDKVKLLSFCQLKLTKIKSFTKILDFCILDTYNISQNIFVSWPFNILQQSTINNYQGTGGYQSQRRIIPKLITHILLIDFIDNNQHNHDN